MKSIEEAQKKFYTEKFSQHGDSPQALSWNDTQTQELRFSKLSELVWYEKKNEHFSLHEVGCGLAHFHDFFQRKSYTYSYSGSDIVSEFLETNKKKHPECVFTYQNISDPLETIQSDIKHHDYYFLNGTFHTKEDANKKEWESFVFTSIKNMYAMAGKGIAFNLLTTHASFYDKKLYYADPGFILNWCIKNLSRFVIIKHHVALYEFYVYIYKPDFIQKISPESLKRYF